MEAMSRSRSRIACFVIPVVLAACRFELPEPGSGSEQVEIDANEGASCGNAVHEPGEECDTGGNTQACDSDCTAPECGDGHLNPVFVPPGTVKPERCDTAGDSDICDADCSPRVCGDGYVNAKAGEECDDNSGCASPSELCWRGCKCMVSIPPDPLHGGAEP